jgi:hypothetical protein
MHARAYGLLAVSAAFVGLGLWIIAAHSGFFWNLLGAVVMAIGGTAAYLISIHRTP